MSVCPSVRLCVCPSQSGSSERTCHLYKLAAQRAIRYELKSDRRAFFKTQHVSSHLPPPLLLLAINPNFAADVSSHTHLQMHLALQAVMALHRFSQLDPTREGALAGVDIDRYLRTMLCDKVSGLSWSDTQGWFTNPWSGRMTRLSSEKDLYACLVIFNYEITDRGAPLDFGGLFSNDRGMKSQARCEG